MIDGIQFYASTGRQPVHDDLQRCNCELAGNASHVFCGWCSTHGRPRFECGCMAKSSWDTPISDGSHGETHSLDGTYRNRY